MPSALRHRLAVALATIAIAAMMFALAAPVRAAAGGSEGRGDWWGRDWSVVAFAGRLTTDDTSDIAVGEFSFDEDAGAYGVGVAKRLFSTGRHLDWEGEFQAVKHDGVQDHWEFNLFLAVRWLTFPWNDTAPTSVAVGNGLSYAAEIPVREREAHPGQEPTQWLNFLFAEVEVGLAGVPRWRLVARYQHRSGAFGTFNGVFEASTLFVGGLKYRF